MVFQLVKINFLDGIYYINPLCIKVVEFNKKTGTFKIYLSLDNVLETKDDIFDIVDKIEKYHAYGDYKLTIIKDMCFLTFTTRDPSVFVYINRDSLEYIVKLENNESLAYVSGLNTKFIIKTEGLSKRIAITY